MLHLIKSEPTYKADIESIILCFTFVIFVPFVVKIIGVYKEIAAEL